MRGCLITLVTLLCMLLLVPQAAAAAPHIDSATPGQIHRLYLPTIPQDEAPAAAANKPALPDSRAFGKTLAEWIILYSRWFLSDLDAAHIGNVRFIPLPAGEPLPLESPADPLILTGEQGVTLAPGTPFVLPLFMLIGERYADGSEDLPLPAAAIISTQVVVTLNGKTIIDSSVDDLSRYYFGPVDYPSPILTQLPDGSLHTFLWIQGIGFVHPPLPVGEHTITLSLVNTDPALLALVGLTGVAGGLGYENSWTITVEP